MIILGKFVVIMLIGKFVVVSIVLLSFNKFVRLL